MFRRRTVDTNVKVDTEGNSYCGPLVLAAIMGVDTAEAARRVRAMKGYVPGDANAAPIKGTHWWELRDTLARHGWRTTHLPVPKHTVKVQCFPGLPKAGWVSVNGKLPELTKDKQVGPTFAQWLRSRPDRGAMYIVEVTGHWVLVKGRKFVDTYTKGEWVFLGSAPHKRRRVCNAWLVTPGGVTL